MNRVVYATIEEVPDVCIAMVSGATEVGGLSEMASGDGLTADAQETLVLQCCGRLPFTSDPRRRAR